MDFFKRTNSLDSIGVVYDEREPRSPTDSTTHDTASGTVEMRAITTVLASQPNLINLDDVFSETSTTADTRTHSSSYPLSSSTMHVQHIREASGDFTFTGQPRAVVHFRSCITANDVRHRTHARAQSGAFADDAEDPETDLPMQTGPFTADILCVLLLHIGVSSHSDIVQIGNVCRFWRYYANLAPHWTYFRRKEWKKQSDLPRWVRRLVSKTKIVTRDDYIKERMKVEDYKRKERLIGTAKHIRWCVATGIIVGVMLTANFVIAYFLGFLHTALRTDVDLGVTTFLLLVSTTLLEVMLVVIPLAGGAHSGATKNASMRILAWTWYLLGCSMVLGTVSALAFTRVQAAGHVLDGPTIDFSMNAECVAYSSRDLPSFVLVPAPLADVRWRPLTMDLNETSLEPYCIVRDVQANAQKAMCFVLMYFDANYSSDVFQNESELLRYKDVGTRLAEGFDPLSARGPISGLWCSTSSHPQIVAVSKVVYDSIAAQRNRLYPDPADWLDPSRRPSSFASISLRCSSNINREKTENPPKSTAAWYGDSTAWKWYYVPLVTNQTAERSSTQQVHDHFLRYAFVCHIVAGALWAAMLLAQIIFKSAPNGILGVTTAITLVCLNPFTMILSGILCVNTQDTYFMCDDVSGGCLIGGGIGLTFLALAIYVTVRE